MCYNDSMKNKHLEHIEDDNEVVADFYDFLPEGGKLLLYLPASNIIWTDLDNKVNHKRRYQKKDLEKFTDIILNEIKRALRRSDSVELRNFGRFSVKTQKASIRRNPRTGEKVSVPEKKVISWKMSKDMFKKINNEE